MRAAWIAEEGVIVGHVVSRDVGVAVSGVGRLV